ncbi:hypothetical protein RND81_01G035300 [Saponaria officinalis]|uniref:Transmembrane protein n=1 Tax=Saponaria officinalis TaxID=3572 RepID=A0AAW1NG02_SAPOF
MENQMSQLQNWVEVAPPSIIKQRKYSSTPKLETIFEEDDIEFYNNVPRKLAYFLPLLVSLVSFFVLFTNFEVFENQRL